jgi:hypothetical protein
MDMCMRRNNEYRKVLYELRTAQTGGSRYLELPVRRGKQRQLLRGMRKQKAGIGGK